MKKSDNRPLFEVIVNAYNLENPNNRIDPIKGLEITDEQMARIKKLSISPDAMRNIKSLNGIEKLVNLEYFSMPGQTIDTSNAAKRSVQNDINYGGIPERIQSDLNYIEMGYNSCQITDLTPLYSLRKLTHINLSNQRNITEVDVSNWLKLTNLQMQNCIGLKKVEGLHTLRVLQNPKLLDDEFAFDESAFDFGGCDNLQKIPQFDTLVRVLHANNEQGWEAHIFLPTLSYPRLCKEYPGMQQKLVEYRDKEYLELFNFIEIGRGGVRCEHNAGQMSMAKNRVDDVIRTVCSKNDDGNDVTRASKLYRWICDHITYDTENLEKSYKEDKTKKYRLSDKIRSSFHCLWSDTAVCVGISNLYNFMLAELGFTAECVSCSSKAGVDPRLAISDHRITKLYINEKPYYCDPTWDLGTDISRHFCLSKSEISKNHSLTIADYKEPDGPSVQPALYKDGCLISDRDNYRDLGGWHK